MSIWSHRSILSWGLAIWPNLCRIWEVFPYITSSFIVDDGNQVQLQERAGKAPLKLFTINQWVRGFKKGLPIYVRKINKSEKRSRGIKSTRMFSRGTNKACTKSLRIKESKCETARARLYLVKCLSLGFPYALPKEEGWDIPIMYWFLRVNSVYSQDKLGEPNTFQK